MYICMDARAPRGCQGCCGIYVSLAFFICVKECFLYFLDHTAFSYTFALREIAEKRQGCVAMLNDTSVLTDNLIDFYTATR